MAAPTSVSDECGSCHRRLILDPSAEMIPHVECQQCRVNPVAFQTTSETLGNGNEENTPSVKMKLCLACFVNPEKHSWDHPYIVVRDWDTLPSPIGPSGWTQRQDMALINGVARFGYDNWEEIIESSLKYAHTKEECKMRFEHLRQLVGEPPLVQEDRSAADAKLREKQQRVPNVPGANLLGYTPLRAEFDHVYADEAERLIADMVFGPEDEDEVEKGQEWYDLKLKVLRNYNLKLDVRECRRRFVLERGLLDFQRIQEVRQRLAMSAQQQSTGVNVANATNALKMDLDALARFMSSQQLEQFKRGIEKERALRDEIRKLQQYRAIGLRTYDEVDAYSKLAAKRNQMLYQQQQMPVGSNAIAPASSPIDLDHLNKRVHLNEGQTLEPDVASAFLAESELELCTRLGLTPSQYFVMKEAILKEALRNGGCISTPQAMALVSVEFTVVDTLLDFFIRCDWVKRTSEIGSQSLFNEVRNGNDPCVSQASTIGTS